MAGTNKIKRGKNARTAFLALLRQGRRMSATPFILICTPFRNSCSVLPLLFFANWLSTGTLHPLRHLNRQHFHMQPQNPQNILAKRQQLPTTVHILFRQNLVFIIEPVRQRRNLIGILTNSTRCSIRKSLPKKIFPWLCGSFWPLSVYCCASA